MNGVTLHAPTTISEARERFFERGERPEGLLPEAVTRSWERCAELGVPSDGSLRIDGLTSAELRENRERSEALLQTAKPELATLFDRLEGTGSLVVLTDATGLILESRGKGPILETASNASLLPGMLWTETMRGTNAIGTALAEQQFVEVWGAEHFHNKHVTFCCTASPLIDPYGRVAGLVDVTGYAQLPPGYARGLVERTVRDVENRWIRDAHPRQAIVRIQADDGDPNRGPEGLLVLDGERIVAASRDALTTMRIDRSMIRVPWSQLFDRALPEEQGRVATLSGIRCRVTVERRPAAAPRPAFANRPLSLPREYWMDAQTRRQLERAVRAVDAGIPVLIQGETGTGKEVFARSLHRSSSRAGAPFVAVNCAAIPEGLIEAELFGYEEGAFTGARRRGSAGLLREANGGILFLDEIGDMPLALQARLLRVLQDHEVVPLGGTTPVKVDFVPLCATHRDLTAAVADNRFREDLYYRLAHYTVTLPPLRECADRAECIRALWAQANAESPRVKLSAGAEAALLAYSWPGNLRQCANLLRTLVVMAEPGAEISVEDLPATMRSAVDRPADPLTLADSAARKIEKTIDQFEGNISAAARSLGVHRSTLYRNRKK